MHLHDEKGFPDHDPIIERYDEWDVPTTDSDTSAGWTIAMCLIALAMVAFFWLAVPPGAIK